MFVCVPNIKHPRKKVMEIQDVPRVSAAESISFICTILISLMVKRLEIKGVLHLKNLTSTDEATEVPQLWYVYHFRKIPLIAFFMEYRSNF